jgi:hypothetical protein
MGAVLSLRFRRALVPRAAVRISLVVLVGALGLLAFAAVLGLINPDPSPASERLLMGPFRWIPPEGA